jgi:hypothetical protein
MNMKRLQFERLDLTVDFMTNFFKFMNMMKDMKTVLNGLNISKKRYNRRLGYGVGITTPAASYFYENMLFGFRKKDFVKKMVYGYQAKGHA